jgi:hypothetical protein
LQNATPLLQLARAPTISHAWSQARDVLLGVTVKTVVALLLALATPAIADDRKHVAVLEFVGPGGANVRGEVVRLAATKSWVSSSSNLDGRTVREFALDHDVELVVQGNVEKRGRDYRISIWFVRGSTGETIGRTFSSLRQPVLDRASHKRVERDFHRALAAIPGRVESRESP